MRLSITENYNLALGTDDVGAMLSARVPQIAGLKSQLAMATSSKPLSQLALEPASTASANDASDLKDKFIDAEAQWRNRERTLHEEVC